MRPFVLCFCLPLLFAGGVAVSAEPPAAYVVSRYPQLMSDRYTAEHGLPGTRVTGVKIEGNAVYVATENGQSVFAEGKWRKVEPNRQVSFALPKIEADKLPPGAKVVSVAQTPDKRLWIIADQGAFRSEGDRYVPLSKPTQYLTRQTYINPDATLTCVATDAQGHVWFGSTMGVFATDGGNFWNWHNGGNGLPVEHVTCLAFGKDGELWVGTTEGVCRYTAQGEWRYYGGLRWLPHNRVHAIAVDRDGAAWIATEGGVARLYEKSVTLAEKAERYQQITDARHNRYGFVTGNTLKKPGDPNGGFLYEASDNDGLWTAFYVGAQAFRYAVTKDRAARTAAQRSMRAMLDLVKYTGIAGFPARAILRKDEKDVTGYDPDETVRVDGETEKIWFTSPVDPNVLCKGDTSSDEMDGHYFAWYLYHELVADAAEKREIAQAVRACTDNILNHDLTLVGHTGRKTRWGVWHPKYINDDPMWWEERGLNALEILCFLKIAHSICKDEKYDKAYRELIEKHHYLLNTVTQKMPEPWWLVNHSDDEMAFMMYYVLMRLEREPDIRRVLNLSLERSWKIERPEASPFFNFVYGAVTGKACDVAQSVEALQDWAWELINWRMTNSHRADLTLRTTMHRGRANIESATAIRPSERRVMKWNGNPYEPDGGSPDGRDEEDGAAWLLPYWMGRYHKIIVEK